MRNGAFGVSSDHGVQGKYVGIVIMIKYMSGIMKIAWVFKGYGGNKLAMEVRVVENAFNKQLSVYLLQFFESGE